MKKQLFFLFAAAALFAGCSSDELVNDGGQQNEGTDTPSVEEITATSFSTTTAEGYGFSVGMLDDAATTRAEGDSKVVYFDMEIPLTNFMQDWKECYLKADDFNIRVNGDYLEPLSISNNVANYGSFKVSHIKNSDTEEANIIKVRAEGIEKMRAYKEGKSYDLTYEIYLWIDNRKLKNDGSGAYEELFTWQNKLDWIYKKASDLKDETSERGFDYTSKIKDTDRILWEKVGENKKDITTDSYGYSVRYNVYRGISGRLVGQDGKFSSTGIGDTPYIKISMSFNRVAPEIKTTVAGIYPKAE